MSISIGPTSSQPLPGDTSSQLGIATTKLALKHQSIEGEGALRLIQQAGQVSQASADPTRGRHIDVFA